MDNLQYQNISTTRATFKGFKPYYKWITFNTLQYKTEQKDALKF